MAYAADKKPGELTALTSLATDDVFVVGDTSDASEVAKYITKANLVTDLTTSFAPSLGADDNYATDAEKVKLSNLSGTNTGDQTSIVGITGTMAQFDTAVSDGNIVYQSQALGTPASGTLTNCTGLPVNGIVDDTSSALGVGTLELGHASDTTIARSGAGAITVEGVQVVLANTSPTLATITTTGNIELGNASDTTLSRSAAGVLAVEGVVVPSISSTNTLTNKRVTRRVSTTNAPGATPTTNTDNVDVMNFTGLGTAITSMTTNLSGTPVDGDLIMFRFTDDGTPRTIAWGASFAATTVALPTTTVASTMLRVGFQYSGSTWKCIATA